ncbi:MAG: DNA polymerase III subunit delta [Thiomargarita sp.]|nr:DNA polymerase III subunit delta [Thiomargarita sp.]
MRIKTTQLKQHLKRQGLASIYLLTGDEPLQIMECTDILRTFARNNGFSERIVLTVEIGFDWNSLNQQANSISLFANKRLIELNLGQKSPSSEGTKALLTYTQQLPADTVLLITTNKLDSSKQKTKWFKALDKLGVVIQIWPLSTAELPKWIQMRMEQYGLKTSLEAINIIAERSEGHLLACAQEIEKLHLLHGKNYIDTEQILEVVSDSARFELFSWIDMVLIGNVKATIRQLHSLQAEGTEAILVLWILNREIRNLSKITNELKTGQSQQQVFKNYRIWSTRQTAVANAIKRYPQPYKWQQFLQKTAKIDRMVKGAEMGNVWLELEQLSIAVAGIALFSYR